MGEVTLGLWHEVRSEPLAQGFLIEGAMEILTTLGVECPQGMMSGHVRDALVMRLETRQANKKARFSIELLQTLKLLGCRVDDTLFATVKAATRAWEQ